MTEQNLKLLKMIAGNCSLEKVQRDMLNKIIAEESVYALHDPSELLPDTDRDVEIIVRWDDEVFSLIGRVITIYGNQFYGWEYSTQRNYVHLKRDHKVLFWREIDKRGLDYGKHYDLWEGKAE